MYMYRTCPCPQRRDRASCHRAPPRAARWFVPSRRRSASYRLASAQSPTPGVRAPVTLNLLRVATVSTRRTTLARARTERRARVLQRRPRSCRAMAVVPRNFRLLAELEKVRLVVHACPRLLAPSVEGCKLRRALADTRWTVVAVGPRAHCTSRARRASATAPARMVSRMATTSS